MLPQLFFAYRPLKKGQKTPRWPQNRFFKKEANIQMLPDFVYKVYMRLKNFQKKSFLKPTSQKNYFAIFLTPKFWKKKFFFNLKIEWLKWVVGPKNAFQSTFLDVLSAPYTICPYLKKKFLPWKIRYFDPLWPSKYQNFWVQNKFLRYGHMV